MVFAGRVSAGDGGRAGGKEDMELLELWERVGVSCALELGDGWADVRVGVEGCQGGGSLL